MALRDRSEDGLRDAKKLFEAAVAEDPNYAEAYSGLADAYYLLGNYDFLPTAEANKKGKEALGKGPVFG